MFIDVMVKVFSTEFGVSLGKGGKSQKTLGWEELQTLLAALPQLCVAVQPWVSLASNSYGLLEKKNIEENTNRNL